MKQITPDDIRNHSLKYHKSLTESYRELRISRADETIDEMERKRIEEGGAPFDEEIISILKELLSLIKNS